MRVWTGIAGMAIANLMIVSCGGGDGPSAPPAEVAEPGLLTAVLALPAGDDRAATVTISGPEAIGAIAAGNSAYVVHSRTNGTTAKAAVFGRLVAGPLFTFAVPDKKKSASYTVTITEVAGPANELREQLAGYAVSITR